jgi:hypothetical protein
MEVCDISRRGDAGTLRGLRYPWPRILPDIERESVVHPKHVCPDLFQTFLPPPYSEAILEASLEMSLKTIQTQSQGRKDEK